MTSALAALSPRSFSSHAVTTSRHASGVNSTFRGGIGASCIAILFHLRLQPELDQPERNHFLQADCAAARVLRPALAKLAKLTIRLNKEKKQLPVAAQAC